jgi:hypothetical protein
MAILRLPNSVARANLLKRDGGRRRENCGRMNPRLFGREMATLVKIGGEAT